MKTPTRMVLKLLLLGLAAIPWFLDRADGPKDAFASQDDIGLGLTESASAVGINFTHRTSPLDPALSHILPSVFGMGASASVTDVNNDGWLDLYLTTSDVGGLNALYINRWDGTFEDMAARYGLADVNQAGTGVSMGAVWADYDSDGLDDMLLYKWGRLTLYHQERDSLFIDVSQESGLGWWMNAGSAIWLDYDNDGDLDIYVGGYYKKGLDLWNLSTTKIMPNSFEYATNGGRNFLLANQGDGTFVDVTEAANADCGCWTLALGAVDLTGDLFPEIVIANDYGQDVLLINRDGERFERGVPGDGKPKSGMNIAFGDVMNDSVQSLYITNISKSGYLAQGNDLWRWLGGGSLKAVGISRSAGVEDAGWAWGAQFGDLNNDGNIDLVVANGFISADRDRDYWYHMSKVAMGSDRVFENVDNWPAIDGRSLSGYERSRLFLNDGRGAFRDVADDAGITDRLDGRAVVLADFFRTGSLDIVIANQREATAFYRNVAAEYNDWIAFDLEGTNGLRSAIGASVTLHFDGGRQSQIVTAGIGYSSQMPRRLHFGLGRSSDFTHAVVSWPSGTVQVVNSLVVGAINRITEPLHPTP